MKARASPEFDAVRQAMDRVSPLFCHINQNFQTYNASEIFVIVQLKQNGYMTIFHPLSLLAYLICRCDRSLGKCNVCCICFWWCRCQAQLLNARSFSALRRLKTYLRATVCQQRLNHLAI